MKKLSALIATAVLTLSAALSVSAADADKHCTASSAAAANEIILFENLLI